MDNYSIITYLESKGLQVGVYQDYLVITAKGSNLPQIQFTVSCKRNGLGGYSFRALYTIPIISGKKDKNRLISEIMDKYGSGKNDYIPLGDTVFDDCEIKEITNVFSMLSISASFMTTDDKHPGEYCYDWLLKGFINKIDESSLIWNN